MEQTDSELRDLAERLMEMRQEKKYLEGEIESVSARIAEAIGEGVKRRVDHFEVRVSEAKPGLRVLDEGDVPEAFLTAKPDRRKLLDHVASTGEIPSGVEVTQGRAIVYVKVPKESPDS